MVAMLLNKADARATYQIVFFNTKTREILYSAPTNGKARGFDYAIIGQVPYTTP